MDECLALADLGASINLMPLSLWKRLSLPELTPTCMTLELADHSITQPIGELTLLVGKEAVTFNLDQTSRYSANYNDMTVNRIDVIELACEKYSQEVLGFSDLIATDAFLALEDDPTSPEVDDSYYDSEGGILLLEAILNSDPLPPPPNQGNYLPEIRKELKVCEAKTDKSSIDEPPEVKLKDLPPHLEYAFLEGDDKLSVIIAKDLSIEEKVALIKVLKSRKRAIAWKLSDIKGINPE
ncbi:reverse transcriptase domain-containing protein, partial [Tanacetum coccineum]